MKYVYIYTVDCKNKFKFVKYELYNKSGISLAASFIKEKLTAGNDLHIKIVDTLKEDK